MATLIIDVSKVLSKIDDEAFERVKAKLQVNQKAFADPKDHPMAGALLSLLCDDKVIKTLDREHFARIIQAVIPKDILELKWLCRYCDLIVRTLGNVQQNTNKDERASKYANHLINTLVPEFKKITQSSTKVTDFTEPLSFVYKIASCLLRCTAHNQYPFDLTVDYNMMEELEKRIYKLPVNIFESYKKEERAYVLFISWILEEIICEQDGLEEVD